MSRYDYEMSKKIEAQDYPFEALVMAAARKADTHNMAALSKAFPETVAELRERFNAPGGLLTHERDPGGQVRHKTTITADKRTVRATCLCGWSPSPVPMNDESYRLLADSMRMHEQTAGGQGRPVRAR